MFLNCVYSLWQFGLLGEDKGEICPHNCELGSNPGERRLYFEFFIKIYLFFTKIIVLYVNEVRTDLLGV